MTRDGAVAARLAHNQEVPGSSPGPATRERVPSLDGAFSLGGRMPQESILKGSNFVKCIHLHKI